MDLLLWLALGALPTAALLVVLVPPLLMVGLGRWSVVPTVLWVTGLMLLALWVRESYRAGVYADETGTEGNIFSTVPWLVAATLAAALSVLAARRHQLPG